MTAPSHNMEKAQKAIRAGAIAGFVSAGMTFLIVAIALAVAPRGPLEFFANPWNFLDVALLLGLSFGILRKSRAAAVGMLIYFIFAKIIITLDTGRVGSLPVAFIFLYYFVRATWGTFAHHRIRRQEHASYRPPRRWIWFALTPVAAILLLLMTIGLLVEAGIIPDSAAVPGAKLSGWHRDKLEEAGILAEAEPVLYFYSDGFLSVLADGNFFTPSRVVSYWQEGEDLYLQSAEYNEISNIDVEYSQSFLDNSVISVQTTDGREFRLFVSGEDGKDKEFYELLLQEWQSSDRPRDNRDTATLL